MVYQGLHGVSRVIRLCKVLKSDVNALLKGCDSLKKVQNPKRLTYSWVVVLGSVFYSSKAAKDVGCFGFRILPFSGGEGLLLFGKIWNSKQFTYCDVGCFGFCILLFIGG